MVGITHSIRFVLLLSVVVAHFAVNVAHADPNVAGHVRLVEVFTTADIRVTGDAAIRRQPGYSKTEINIYELDGIQRFEVQLSNDLPADPKQSRQIALQRIQQLDKASYAQVQQDAMGLAKAMEYGVDRYPAIVFDGEAVVYGLKDLGAAFDHYQTWQAGDRP